MCLIVCFSQDFTKLTQIITYMYRINVFEFVFGIENIVINLELRHDKLCILCSLKGQLYYLVHNYLNDLLHS